MSLIIVSILRTKRNQR